MTKKYGSMSCYTGLFGEVPKGGNGKKWKKVEKQKIPEKIQEEIIA